MSEAAEKEDRNREGEVSALTLFDARESSRRHTRPASSVVRAFMLNGNEGERIVEQVGGVVEIDGELYFVEMKWWKGCRRSRLVANDATPMK